MNSPGEEGQGQSAVRKERVLKLGGKRGKFEDPRVV